MDKSLSLYCFCLALTGLTPQLLADLEALEAEVQADYEQRLGALFEHFHANPELSFVEFKTAARMADEMQALGYEVTSGIGGTGVIGVLENGPGPLVMMRADMDGLPVREETGLLMLPASCRKRSRVTLCPSCMRVVMTFISRRLSVLPDIWQTIEMNGLEH